MSSSIPFNDNDLSSQSSYLYRFALAKLRDEEMAREAVQETFLAALENRKRFAGRSSLKTWLTAILKFKIIDLIRARAKQPLLPQPAPESSAAGDELAHLAEAASEAAQPAWQNPDQALENKRFSEIFEVGLAALPAKTRQVFTLRDVYGYSTEEICKEVGITETNCWVILHRARSALRAHLTTNWFEDRAPGNAEVPEHDVPPVTVDGP
jgi:RNA polymerase sigma-70 factor, ECF subfamily